MVLFPSIIIRWRIIEWFNLLVHNEELRFDNKVYSKKKVPHFKGFDFCFSVAGVLKSVLQVFFGLFVFDRLSININTIIGIALSLVAGTMFTYMEYTSKQRKSDISMNDIHDQEQNQPHINSPSNTQDITTNTEKFVHSKMRLLFLNKEKFLNMLRLMNF